MKTCYLRNRRDIQSLLDRSTIRKKKTGNLYNRIYLFFFFSNFRDSLSQRWPALHRRLQRNRTGPPTVICHRNKATVTMRPVFRSRRHLQVLISAAHRRLPVIDHHHPVRPSNDHRVRSIPLRRRFSKHRNRVIRLQAVVIARRNRSVLRLRIIRKQVTITEAPYLRNRLQVAEEK